MQDNSQLVALKNQLDDLERKWQGVPRKPLAVCRRMSVLRFEITKEWNHMEREQRHATCTLPDARSPSDQSPLS